MGFSLFFFVGEAFVLRRFLEVPFRVVFQVRVSSAPPPLGLTLTPRSSLLPGGLAGLKSLEKKELLESAGGRGGGPAAKDQAAGVRERGGNRGRTGVCRHRKGFGGARDLLRRGSLSSTVAAPWRKNGRSVANTSRR